MFAKKNLVAAAALLALVGAAQAQVKVYGSVDMSFGSFETAHVKGVSTNPENRKTAVQSGQMMTSFLGFSGSEDLGGGLKAEFALETFLGADTGGNLANNGGGFWGRASNVALSGGFGKVALGQYDNALFTSGYTYDPFGSSMAFSPTMRHFGFLNQTGFGGVGFDTGWVNSITYETPNMSGFTGSVQFAPKESTASTAKDSYSVSGAYNAGPLSIMLVYVKGGATAAPVAMNTTTPQAYKSNEKVTSLGASYDFGVVKTYFSYAQVKETELVANKDKIYQIGASIPVTDKGAVLLSYGELKNTVTGAATSSKDRVLSVGYDYNLSKRTDVYAVFSNNAQSNTTNDESGQTFAFGIKHSF